MEPNQALLAPKLPSFAPHGGGAVGLSGCDGVVIVPKKEGVCCCVTGTYELQPTGLEAKLDIPCCGFPGVQMRHNNRDLDFRRSKCGGLCAPPPFEVRNGVGGALVGKVQPQCVLMDCGDATLLTLEDATGAVKYAVRSPGLACCGVACHSLCRGGCRGGGCCKAGGCGCCQDIPLNVRLDLSYPKPVPSSPPASTIDMHGMLDCCSHRLVAQPDERGYKIAVSFPKEATEEDRLLLVAMALQMEVEAFHRLWAAGVTGGPLFPPTTYMV